MNINKSIVVVNEFTINGSRGKSPGKYVLEYMARDQATENLTPVNVRPEQIARMEDEITRVYKRTTAKQPEKNLAAYVVRYMARETATEVVSLQGVTNTQTLEGKFEDIEGLSGRAFGPDCISLSHEDVKKKSKMIQAEFEKGKPILKTVISFDTEYLKEMGVLPEDLEVKKRGDLYGKSDQGKLRIAIQQGLTKLKPYYSDMDYIGVIQVDTKHVHCHLAIADKGPGKRFTKNGEQKGMIDDKMKAAIRRGIDNSLNHDSLIKPLSIQMESERRNAISFIKRFTYKVMEERGLPQYLLACLPKDRKDLWSANINTDGGTKNVMTVTKNGSAKQVRGNMKKANEILRGYVIDLLNRPDSGFKENMRVEHVRLVEKMKRGDFDNEYITRTKKSGNKTKKERIKLTPEEAVRKAEKQFKEDLIIKGMNSVYGILKKVDDKSVTLHTPLLDAMSMPYEDMANYVKEDKLIEFGFRLRSYSSRLDYHRENYKKIGEVVHQYEDGDQSTYAAGSKAVYDFLKNEQEYNHALMCKYQTFLHFYHINDEYQEDYDELMYLRHRSYNRHAMAESSQKEWPKTPEKLEQHGRDVYGLTGMSLLMTNVTLFQQQMALEDKEYTQGLRNFKEKLATFGLLYNEEEDSVSQGLEYNFDDVKAYDLHHMAYDFTYDFKIAITNVNNFVDMANKRYELYKKAAEYLESTGQDTVLDGIINVADIERAKSMADEFRRTDNTYHTRFDDSDLAKTNSATIRLDNQLYDELSDRSVLQSLRDIMNDIDSMPEVVDDSESSTLRPHKF